MPYRDSHFKPIPIFLGAVLGLLVGLAVSLTSAGLDASLTAGITALCAVWWTSDAIPLPVTALVPLALFPIFGVLSPDQVASALGNQLILLFLGGFMLSSAIEKSGAHRRLALAVVGRVGSDHPRRLVFGFMVATSIISMFMSNTAAVLMMLPIIMATTEGANNKHLDSALFLGVAYSASIAGIATPIGTPPNLIFLQAYESVSGESISFAEWMGITLPIVLVMIPITGFWLTRKLDSKANLQLPLVGDWTMQETRVLCVVGCVALLWITRTEPFGGWSELLMTPNATDASVALTGVVVLFLISGGDGDRLLDWKTASSIPWGMLLLFAGGIAIAGAFSNSGLGAFIGGLLSSIGTLPQILMLFLLCLSVTFLTELTSNTATAALIMPVLSSVAISSGVPPLNLMLPAVISVTFAFMLPVATPTNAVVYGTQKVAIATMVREGLVLNIVGVLVLTTYFSLIE